jgi:hypothetical protein
MYRSKAESRLEKPAFEPSLLIEYGDAKQITEAGVGPGNNIDGPNYTS